jgi:hypothetical protein
VRPLSGGGAFDNNAVSWWGGPAVPTGRQGREAGRISVGNLLAHSSTPGYNWGMDEERHKSSVTFWCEIAALILIGYPLSFGPVCWIHQREKVAGRAIWVAYYPALWAANQNHAIDDGLLWYAGLGAPESVTPVFENGELHCEGVWETLVRRRNWHRWNYAPASQLAPAKLP